VDKDRYIIAGIEKVLPLGKMTRLKKYDQKTLVFEDEENTNS
jgi:hypothetical protein